MANEAKAGEKPEGHPDSKADGNGPAGATQTKGGAVDWVKVFKPSGAGNIGARDRNGFTSSTASSLDEQGLQFDCLSMESLEAADQEHTFSMNCVSLHILMAQISY